jgi:hypothetical protein
MKKKISIIAFLLICGLIIGSAIYAGDKHHHNCPECKMGLVINYHENANTD